MDADGRASPPCATSCTWAGPNATAWPASSRLLLRLRPLATRYCSSRLPSATANDPDDPPWSCQSVSWPCSQASSQTSQELDLRSGRYQRTSGSRTTRSAHSSRLVASCVVTARNWAGDSRPLAGEVQQRGLDGLLPLRADAPSGLQARARIVQVVSARCFLAVGESTDIRPPYELATIMHPADSSTILPAATRCRRRTGGRPRSA